MNEPQASKDTTAASSPPKRKSWLRRLVLIGFVLCGLALAYIEFVFRRPIGEGPAGPKVDAALFNEVWSEQPVVLVGIGDSVTAGLGAKVSSHSYFQRIAENPSDEWPDLKGVCLSKVLPNLSKLNIAISGTTSLQHVDAIADRLPTFQPDQFGIVVMTTGGNDIIHSYGRSDPREGAMYGATLQQAEPWIQNFSERLDGMLTEIISRFPGGCEIYLADIYDPTDGVGDALSVYLPKWNDGLAIHSKYNETIRKVAKKYSQVHLVPMYEAFLGHGSHCRQFWRSTYDWSDPHYWYFENIEDPNDRGYDAIRRVFLNRISESTTLRVRKGE
jgi:lysophospholipase L1-like esterase